MPSAKTLIGLGEAASLSNALGNTITSKTGVLTVIGTATQITSNFTLLTAAGGQDAFQLPATAVGDGPYIVANISATTAQVFPRSGETIQGGSSSAAFNVAQNKTAMFFKTTATAWVVNLSA